MAFTYPPTGSSGTTSGNDKAIQLITGAPAGWYGPKGVLNTSNRYWDKSFITLTPMSFSKDFVVTDWAVLAKEWDTAGATFQANGGNIQCAVYNSDDNTYAPTTLLANLGSQDIPATAPGSGTVPCIKTLSETVTLSANKVYWVGLRKLIKNGSGGYTFGDGVELAQCIPTGAGVTSSIPVGNNNLSWSQGQKGAIYDDANSSVSNVNTWVSSHAGLYPFVSWAAADLVTISQGDAIFLKGAQA